MYRATYLRCERLPENSGKGYILQEIEATIDGRVIESLEPGSFLLLFEDSDGDFYLSMRLGTMPRYDWLEVRADSTVAGALQGKQFWKLIEEWEGDFPSSLESSEVLALAKKISLKVQASEDVAAYESRFPNLQVRKLDRKEEILLPESLPLIGQRIGDEPEFAWLKPQDHTAAIFGRGSTAKKDMSNGECLASLKANPPGGMIVDLVAGEFSEPQDTFAFAESLMNRHSDTDWESLRRNSNLAAWRSGDDSVFCLAISPDCSTFKKSNLVVLGTSRALLGYFGSEHFVGKADQPNATPGSAEEFDGPDMLADILVYRTLLEAVSERASKEQEVELKEACAQAENKGVQDGVGFARKLGRVPTNGEFTTLKLRFRNEIGLGAGSEQAEILEKLVESYSDGFAAGCENALESMKPAF